MIRHIVEFTLAATDPGQRAGGRATVDYEY